jgi:NADH-quinone oxidoreductase subunit A
MRFQLSAIPAFVLVGLSVPLLMLTLGWLVRPRTPSAEKLTTYECGELPVAQAWFNFNPRFYVVALVFLLFDVEVVFTYPVAVAFERYRQRGLGALALGELALFLGVLGLALAYAWRKGDLDWPRAPTLRDPGPR